MERLGIICSGGDSQGMNACVKTIVNICTTHGILPIAIRRGYQGLIENDMMFLNNEMVQNIDNLGGCIIKVSRSKEFMTQSGVKKAVNNLIKNQIDAVVVIGGEGSFKGAESLEKNGINVICVPATIDNDLFYTDMCLGFDTAVNNAVKAIDNIRQTMEANNRALVVETMGRECGAITLSTALATTAHSVAMRETKTDLKDVVNDVKYALSIGIESPLVIATENLKFSLEDIANALEKNLKIECRTCKLGYIQRGGAPSVADRNLAIKYGITAVELALQNKFGVAIGVKNGTVIAIKIADANRTPKQLDLAPYFALKKLYNRK